MRLLSGLAALLAALSLAGTAAAATHELQVNRGVVQPISSSSIVLRELDGSIVPLAVGPDTRVLLNGLPATLADIQPGFVAAVVHDGTQPARAIRAFGRLQATVDRGVVVSRAAHVLTILTDAGEAMSFRITQRTKIRWHGLPARIAALRPGRFVEVAHTPAGEALRVAIHARRST